MCVMFQFLSILRLHNHFLARALLHAWVFLRAQDRSRMGSWFARRLNLARRTCFVREPYPLSMRVSAFVRSPRRMRESWYWFRVASFTWNASAVWC